MRCVLDKGESRMVVIIPAYQPDQKLHRLVLALHEQTKYDIVIVNDGSDADRQPLFDSLEPYAKIMTHKVNRGKGAALKTALTYIYEQYPADEGVITIDADGQHLPVVVCDDPRYVMAIASARVWGHPARNMTSFGVTGTNGKSTTVLMLASALAIWFAFGFNVFTMFPIAFCLLGGILALAAKQPDAH